jgi:hypothetical protein
MAERFLQKCFHGIQPFWQLSVLQNTTAAVCGLHYSDVVFALLRLGLHCSSQKNEEQAD